MHEIICPHCEKAFKIDEAGYADILKQVRDHEFEQQLHERLELAEQDKRNAVELATTKVTSELEKASAAKDAEIKELMGRLDAGEVTQKLAVTEALRPLEKERDTLANELKQATHDKQTASQLAEAKLVNELQIAAAKNDSEVQGLRSDLERAQFEKQLAETSLKDKYETQIKDREDEIDRLRDMKARLSTKMVGETLEQHCETEFNRIRATAFSTAHFEKDNDARTGSKGDYIFRDLVEAGTEIVSSDEIDDRLESVSSDSGISAFRDRETGEKVFMGSPMQEDRSKEFEQIQAIVHRTLDLDAMGDRAKQRRDIKAGEAVFDELVNDLLPRAMQMTLHSKFHAGFAHFAYGLLLRVSGQQQEAVEQFRKSLSHSPNTLNTLLEITRCLGESDNHSEAMGFAQKAVEVEPTSSQAWGNLAMVLIQLGEMESAGDAINEALAIEPECPVNKNIKALFDHNFGEA